MTPITFNESQVNFIQGYYIEQEICDNLIALFKKNKLNHVPGTLGSTAQGPKAVNLDIKDSTDYSILPTSAIQEWTEYRESLAKCARSYVDIFPNSANTDSWGIVENANIQYYRPGGGYKIWHTERPAAVMPCGARHLTFMTYLNDVTDQGETEFYHQKIKVKPEKGLTLIWPTDWTYNHRGVVSPTQEKYIITGWFSFLNH